MIRKTVLLIVSITASVLTAAQTTVTGTVKDINGNPYANGTVQAFYRNAQGQQVFSPTIATNSGGFFTMTLGANTFSFIVCATPPLIGPRGSQASINTCFTSLPIIISGATQDIGSALSSGATLLGPGGGGGAGSGTVGTCATPGQYGIYNGNTSITCTPNLGESGGAIQANIPITVNTNIIPGLTVVDNSPGNAFQIQNVGGTNQVGFDLIGAGGLLINSTLVSTSTLQANGLNLVGQSTLTPTAGVNQLAANSAGALLYSQNGGAFAPVGGGGGPTTRTWSFAFQGVCQGGVASAPINIPPTNGPSYVPCDATHITSEWQIPASSTTTNFFVKLRVPAGVTGAYTLTTTFRSAATSGSVTLQPAVACVGPGSVPDSPTFSSAGISPITLTPSATSLANVTTTGTFTPSCAAGSDLYVQYTFTANTVTSPVNFSYVSLAVQGSL